MEDKDLQKLIFDFGQLLNGNMVLVSAYKQIIAELQNKIKETE